MKIPLPAILALVQMIFAAGCQSASAPRLRADPPQDWRVLTELASDDLTMKVLAPAKAEFDAGIGVTCAPAAKMPAEERFRSLVRQVREMTGAASVEVYEPAKTAFVLSYAYESASGAAYIGRGTVKTDSAGLGRTLVISGFWPATADKDLSRVYADFAASVDFR